MLAADEVHVWRASLNSPQQRLQYLHGMLAAKERERAARFHFAHDRRNFIAARGLLREILSHYLQLSPHTLQFKYTARGKPYLTHDCGGQWLRFNVSHSGELALYAISRGRELGVDIEECRTDIEHRQIASNFFSKLRFMRFRRICNRRLSSFAGRARRLTSRRLERGFRFLCTVSMFRLRRERPPLC